jgi:signal transduction histidine kinase/CheY-like chemotaxis protein
MSRLLSLIFLPHFLWLIGLNLINPLHGDYQEGPAYRFASKLDGVPAEEFCDILKVRDTVWFAGQGLSRLRAGKWETVLSDGRYTALAHEPERDRIWFAGPDGIGYLQSDGETPFLLGDVKVGYIWDFFLESGRLWFVGASGYGWVGTQDLTVRKTQMEFAPRPFVSVTTGEPAKAFVGSSTGLRQVIGEELKVILPLENSDGQIVAWVAQVGDENYLGTPRSIFQWESFDSREIHKIQSEYAKYFEKGISNGLVVEDRIAITIYPKGVAIWDPRRRKISSYSSKSSGLHVGDVFKIDSIGESQMAVLGTGGIGVVDFSQGHLFFPSDELLDNETVRVWAVTGNGGYVFTDNFWLEFSDRGYRRDVLPHTAYWAGTDPDQKVYHGAVTGYKVLNGDQWLNLNLSLPVWDLTWGNSRAYAWASDGIHTVDRELAMSLVHPSDASIFLLGEIGESFYFIEDQARVVVLRRKGGALHAETLHEGIGGRPAHRAVLGDGILFASGGALYRLSKDESLEELAVEEGWEVRGLAGMQGTGHAAFHNPATGESAIGSYDWEGRRMLAVPHLEIVGTPSGLMVNRSHLGVVGANGVGWYGIEQLAALAAPSLTFGLFLDGEPVADRTIPGGTQFIDLRVDFGDPAVPGEVHYRINGQRWRALNPADPVLQFAGHGNFLVEARAVHPNGTSSEIERIQFGIAAPWYLNPLYQGLLLALAVLMMWGVYALRHAQLKRTNIWLANEVKKQTRELEAATVARTNFLAGLSHDIRNPLNGVLMIAETLTRDPPRNRDDSRLKDLTEFGVIVDRMLGEILDFSAIDQTNMPMAYIPVSIPDILNSSVRQNQFSIQKALVNIAVLIAPELKETVIKADRNWMIKILTNLIVNALEYSESERIEVGAICHRLTPHDVEMEIYVKDWGKGIDDAEKPFVFDRFYRGESGIESGKHGTGLGLSICQEIAHAMGAHLMLKDNEPSGACFTLKGRFERVAGVKELDCEAVLRRLEGKKVLVVDDLAYNRRSIVDFLRTIGCECDQSENGREALAMLGENRYDIALLDWDLPGLMGPEIARRHRKAHPNDPVTLIALTAYTDGEKKRESGEAGMNGYISKPLTATRLAYCIAGIGEHKPQRQLGADAVNMDELNDEIYKHVEDCLEYGAQYEWENLRRCAHRLTTLALMRNNPAMQQVCRDLQVSAQSGNIDEVRVSLAELRQWAKP